MVMWSLQNLMITLYVALSCVRSAAGLIHASGYEGGEGKVVCPYGEGYESYEKYLCKNECSNDDVLITTTSAKKNRYSISDDKHSRVFTATISDLSLVDAGKYWCGVTRTGKDFYTEVKLEVGQDNCCDKSTKIQSYEGSSGSISCPYVSSKYQDNLKYICRGNKPSTCQETAIITSDNKQNGQFRLADDKALGKFTVTITSLMLNNSGSYLCGVRVNSGLDIFSAFELEVKEWCCVKSNKMSSIVGHPAAIQCPYPPQHRDNRKFLCKGDHRNNCTDMVTHQSRFTLQDDVSSSSFLVLITELKVGDAGTYWCGSDSQWTVANYTRIQLSVVFPQQTSTVISTIPAVEPVESQSTQIPGKQSKDAALFKPVVAIVPALLLTLTFALVMVYKYKCFKVRAGANIKENKTMATITEEVIAGADFYENQGVAYSKQRTSKQQSACQLYDDAEQDSVYQNFTTTDDIYCNQVYANRR
ncbi:polymeric immunoglobulin receptor-like isoform X2 [Plectropomus leopardus]|uniref:polymeric immunoglobulin receptor-like isoform X2 n=1 Tax=Plectropomus leopardus TaxID=160734 RepID=UPI001C4C56FB|nr:polymeric immunoglobulin receptor-like isoform X2 [Plectropomus leopardus]